MLCGLKLAELLKTIPPLALQAIPAAPDIVAAEPGEDQPTKKRSQKTKPEVKE
jgi:hypothetical protein